MYLQELSLLLSLVQCLELILMLQSSICSRGNKMEKESKTIGKIIIKNDNSISLGRFPELLHTDFIYIPLADGSLKAPPQCKGGWNHGLY